MLKGKSLIEPGDLSLEELEEIFKLAEDIVDNPDIYQKACQGKILGSLFYEPSTRTRLSFEAAMYRLGGQVIGFSEAATSSVSKGESIGDTIRTIGCYADIAVMRHPKEGAPKLASKYANIPVINGGDGGHQHPTQTLTDLLTIYLLKSNFSNLKIGLCGDLKFGRTVHSLVKAMARYQGTEFAFISPQELKIPDYIKDDLNSSSFSEHTDLETVLPELDILYMTRVQKERFVSEEEYLRLRDSYILNKAKLTKASPEMIVMHPLPRVNEIAEDIDDDPRTVYFDQARYGMFVRMALIMKLLGVDIDA